MKLNDFLCGLDIVSCENCDICAEVNEPRHDSRKIQGGDIFIALRGSDNDGHSYLKQAFDNGAAVAVVEEVTDEIKDRPYIKVKNTRAALSKMCASYFGHPEKDLKLIAVTGTNGKTSTANLIYSVLRESGKKCGLISTVETIIGDEHIRSEMTSPDPYEFFSILKKNSDLGAEYIIMEASSHSLALNKYCGLRFSMGIFTNLTHDHLDFHKTMDEYAKAKASLFEQCDIALFNYDDAYGRMIYDGCGCKNKYYYSVKNFFADYIAKNIKLKGPLGIEYRLYSQGHSFKIISHMSGEFSVYNTLAAASCAKLLGIDIYCIKNGIRKMHCVKGRLQRIKLDCELLVYIDFAHTPDAMLNVIKTVRGFLSGGKLITVFGCGGERDAEKRPEMGEIGARYSDIAVITSDNSRSEDAANIIEEIKSGILDTSNCVFIEDRAEAIRYAVNTAEEKDIILLCGKGHEEYCEDKNGKHRFSEEETVREAVRQKYGQR